MDEWEMYEMHQDPDEMNSVYNDPNYVGIQEDFYAKLAELRDQYGDSEELSQVPQK